MADSGAGIRWKEAVAALSVVGSLMFVGVQIRQSTVASRAASINELRAGINEFSLTIAADPELTRVYHRWRTEVGGFTPEEQTRMEILVFALLRNAEAAYLQTTLGLLDAGALQGYGFSGSPTFANPNFEALWPNIRHRFDPKFASAFEASYGLGDAR